MSRDTWKTIWHAVILIIIFLWIAAGVKELLFPSRPINYPGADIATETDGYNR